MLLDAYQKRRFLKTNYKNVPKGLSETNSSLAQKDWFLKVINSMLYSAGYTSRTNGFFEVERMLCTDSETAKVDCITNHGPHDYKWRYKFQPQWGTKPTSQNRQNGVGKAPSDSP